MTQEVPRAEVPLLLLESHDRWEWEEGGGFAIKDYDLEAHD